MHARANLKRSAEEFFGTSRIVVLEEGMTIGVVALKPEKPEIPG